MTGFSVVPLQFFSMAGMVISLISLLGFIGLAIRRLVHGPEAEGLFTLFAIAFFLIGVLLMGVGVVGEYVGRIYEQVRQRPRYTVAALLEQNSTEVRSFRPRSVHDYSRCRVWLSRRGCSLPRRLCSRAEWKFLWS